MASSSSVFGNYVKEAKTLSSMKSFFSAFEEIGVGDKLKSLNSKNLFETIGDLSNEFTKFYNEQLGGINSVDDLLNKFGVTEDINKLKDLLQNQFDGLMSKVGNTIGPAYKSFLSALNISDSDMRNLMLMIKPFILNEKVLLEAIKKIYYGLDEKPDINFNNNLANICLTSDFPLILEWVDGVNNTTYSIREKELLNRADYAAKNGSFHVVHYIMKQLTYSYKEFNTVAAVSKEDKECIDNSKLEYEEWSVNTFKTTIVNSINNFTVSDYRSFLDEDIIPIPISSYGTSDGKYHKRFLIKEKELDEFVPIYKNEIGGKSTTRLLPKNKNIKKIYVSMANEINDKMINQPFHDRLDFPLFTPKEKAYSTINDIFGGKPESIVKYAKDFLFQFNTIKNQVVGFIKDNEAMISPILSKVGLKYEDFDFILKIPDLTVEGISKKIIDLSIEKGKQLFYNETTVTRNETITVTDPETGDTHTETREVKDKYIVITDKEISDDIPEDQKQDILNIALAKDLIDKMTKEAKQNGKELNLSDLAAMYPSLSNEFEYLNEYIENCMKPEVPTIKDVSIDELDFFTSIQNADGSVSSIEDVGIVKTTPDGKTKIIGKDINGIPLGLSNYDGKLVILSKNDNGEVEMWIENPETGSFDKSVIPPEMSSDINIIDGLGISSATNIVYYKAAYYNDKLFTIENKHSLNKDVIAVYEKLNTDDPVKIGEIDVIGSLKLDDFKEIKGISFLANGKIYAVITDYGVIEIEFNNKYIITSAYKIGEYTDNLMYNTKNIGTIFNSVDINVNDLYDFDIDDPKIIKSILNYYNKNRELIYHYKIKNGVINVERHRDDWESKEPYDKYSDEKDNTYRRENDYRGMSDEIEHTVYYGTEDIFNKYNEIMSDPTKTENDNPGFKKDEEE